MIIFITIIIIYLIVKLGDQGVLIRQEIKLSIMIFIITKMNSNILILMNQMNKTQHVDINLTLIKFILS